MKLTLERHELDLPRGEILALLAGLLHEGLGLGLLPHLVGEQEAVGAVGEGGLADGVDLDELVQVRAVGDLAAHADDAQHELALLDLLDEDVDVRQGEGHFAFEGLELLVGERLLEALWVDGG